MNLVEQELLFEKFRTHQATVAIIGLGYVGLPLAVEFAEADFCVIGVDVSEEKCAVLNRSASYIGDVPASRIAPLVKSGKLQATTDTVRLYEADAIIICVPTPLNKTHEPDISFVVAATEAIIGNGRPGQLVVLESTTYPGTTSELLQPRLEAAGYTLGKDCWLAFSPERIDPGNETFGVHNTPKVIGGSTPACTELAAALYRQIIGQVVPVSSTETAEMVKLLENTFRMVNIGLINEVAQWCHQLGINVWEVIEAAATKPFGFMPFYPGPGLGGHCIPIDPMYLSWKLRGMNHTARFIELAREINLAMPQYVVTRVADALNEYGKAIRGARILVLGVAYKPNVADLRESPALEILRLLSRKGAQLQYADPFVSEVVLDEQQWQASDLSAETLHDADCVLIVTHHSDFPWDMIATHSRLIVDTRNALRRHREQVRVVKL